MGTFISDSKTQVLCAHPYTSMHTHASFLDIPISSLPDSAPSSPLAMEVRHLLLSRSLCTSHLARSLSTKSVLLFHPAYYSHTCSLRAFSLTDIFQSPTSVAVEQHYSKTSHRPNTSQATQLLMTPEERRHCESLGVSSGPFHGHRPTTHPTVGCKLTKGWKWPQLAHRGHFQLCTHTCLSSVIQFLLGSGASFYFCIFLRSFNSLYFSCTKLCGGHQKQLFKWCLAALCG